MTCLISFFQQAYKPVTFTLCKKAKNAAWEDFLTKKFGLWVDTRPSTDNSHHSRIGQQQIVGFYFRLKKQLKVVMVIPHVMLPVLKVQQLVLQLTTLVEF